MPNTSHQLTKKVKFLHKVALISNDQILILKRSDDSKSRPGKWDLPGGNSEWPVTSSESVANLHTQDISREIFEETGLRVRPEVFSIKSLVHFSSFFDAQSQVYTIICGWMANVNTQEVEISDEHTNHVWIDHNELQDFDFGASKAEFITDTIEKTFNKHLA